MSRRPSSPSVSLFPFLAVLMCALGALILLLLVTAGRIRNEAFEKALAADAAPITKPVVAPSAEVVPEPVVQPEPFPAAIPEPLPPASPTAEELRREWEQAVADLERREAELAAALDAALRSAQEAQTALARAESEIGARQGQSAALDAQRSELIDAAGVRAARQARLEWELTEVNTELERVRRRNQEDQGRFRVMPYDGQSGTTRRPILIECTAHGLTFAAEGITLTPEQLNGFSPIKNPLLAGVDALITYWSVQDLKGLTADDRTGSPYVLLIVRPGGAVGYYVARRLLEAMNDPYGYELVTEEQQFRWPDRNPQAAAVCQAAIDAVLAQKSRLQPQVAGGRLPVGSPLQFSNGTGEFYLEEVEQLRGGERMVHVGGRSFERTPSGGGTDSLTGRETPARSDDSDERSRGRAGGASGTGPRVMEIPRHGSPGGTPAPHRAGSTGTSGLIAASPSPGDQGSPAAPPTDAQTGSASTAGLDETSTHSEPRAFKPGSERSGAGIEAAAPSGTGNRSSAGEPAGSATGVAGGPESEFAAGSGGPGGEPPDPFAPNRTAGLFSHEEGGVDPQAPQWGARTPGSSIGLEREVIVRVDDSQVAVARELPITITPGMTRDELQRALAETLDAHIRAWGLPPKSFYWMPVVRYQVLPGGNQYLKRLTEVTDEWSVKSHTEYVLE